MRSNLSLYEEENVYVSVSEVGRYVFCPFSLVYHLKGVPPVSESKANLAKGVEIHKKIAAINLSTMEKERRRRVFLSFIKYTLLLLLIFSLFIFLVILL